MNGLALLIVYGNLAMVFQPTKLGLEGAAGLPLPLPIEDAFQLTGMFSSYLRDNSLYVIEGRHAGDSEPETWIAIETQEHFPERMGITAVQLHAVRFRSTLGEKAQLLAWNVMARKIRQRHNRLHPDAPIDRVRFGVKRWPISPNGYWARKGLARYKRFYAEDVDQ